MLKILKRFDFCYFTQFLDCDSAAQFHKVRSFFATFRRTQLLKDILIIGLGNYLYTVEIMFLLALRITYANVLVVAVVGRPQVI